MTADDLDGLFAEPVRGGVFEVGDPASIGDRLAAAGWSVAAVDHFEDRDGFYRQIAAALEFPAYFGHNLDALWDCLRGVPGRSAVIIAWGAFAEHDPAAAGRIRSVLEDRARVEPPIAIMLAG